jgi:adenylate cyclase class 2
MWDGIIMRDADSGRMSSMTVEIEVKSRIDDARRFERGLRKAGARMMKETVENDVYYSHPCRDFASTDEAVRIRRSGTDADLTYKGPKLDKKSKTREEIVIPLDGPDGAALADAMLLRLGFGKVARVQKRRRLYKLGRFEICVDRVAGLGDFFEIEARGPKKGYERLRDEALALMHRLGGREPERRSYLELLLSTK